MRIGNVEVKISIISILVFVFFTIILVFTALYSPDVRSNLIWMIPALLGGAIGIHLFLIIKHGESQFPEKQD